MNGNSHSVTSRSALVKRFWSSARGFWLGEDKLAAWALTIGLVAIVLLQLSVQYGLNVWNRDLFNAIENKDGDAVIRQAVVFAPLAITTVVLAVVAVYGRMTMQRHWRAWVADELMSRWLAKGHYYQLNLTTGEHHV